MEGLDFKSSCSEEGGTPVVADFSREIILWENRVFMDILASDLGQHL